MSVLMVEIVNVSNEVLTLPMDDTQDYFIKDIVGLDPVKAEIVESSYGTIDGTLYQSSRRGSRNPVITICCKPSKRPSQLEGKIATKHCTVSGESKSILEMNLLKHDSTSMNSCS